MITQQELIELFDYKDGSLYWKKMCTHKCEKLIGERAGYKHKYGYRIISVKGVQYKEHRLIFLYHHGFLPKFIDHVNCVKNDNRIENLRPATKIENCRNFGTPKHNTSGVKGVSISPRSKNWRARLSINGKLHQVGGFKTKELAAEFMELWRDLIFGNFSNHGIKGI